MLRCDVNRRKKQLIKRSLTNACQTNLHCFMDSRCINRTNGNKFNIFIQLYVITHNSLKSEINLKKGLMQ